MQSFERRLGEIAAPPSLYSKRRLAMTYDLAKEILKEMK